MAAQGARRPAGANPAARGGGGRALAPDERGRRGGSLRSARGSGKGDCSLSAQLAGTFGMPKREQLLLSISLDLINTIH